MKSYRYLVKSTKFILGILVLYILVGNFASKNNSLYNMVGYNNFVVLSGSMEPKISAGDYISIIKCNVDKLKKGDIITFYLNKEVVTHRIKDVNGQIITTKGDSNNISDNKINKKDVIGKYIFKIPKLGYLISFISSLSGIIIIIGTIVILLFWEYTNKTSNNKGIVVISKKEYKSLIEAKKKLDKIES